MNEKTNLVKEEHTLPEAPWIDISIEPENSELFEAFCERNRIPYETINSTAQTVTCSVRDGMDIKDVMAYMLRKSLTPEDKDTCECVYMLFLMRNSWIPEYDYEYGLYRDPEDDLLLSQCPDIF